MTAFKTLTSIATEAKNNCDLHNIKMGVAHHTVGDHTISCFALPVKKNGKSYVTTKWEFDGKRVGKAKIYNFLGGISPLPLGEDMATQPETRLQRRIQKALRKGFPGSWWYKVWGGPFTPAGIPDLIGCVSGYLFALEVKRPVKSSKTSEVQNETINDICQAGGHATVIRSPQEAVDYVTIRVDKSEEALRIIRLIAEGHNDPRRVCKTFLGVYEDD